MNQFYQKFGIYLHFRPSKVIWHRYFMAFVRDLPQKAGVLDIACEKFMNADYFQNQVYFGADRNIDSIKNGLARFQDGRAVQCDMRYPPFPDNCFDAVVSTHSLSHLSQDDDVLLAVKQFSRVSKSKLFFNTPLKSRNLEAGLDRLLEEYFEDIQKVRYSGILTYFWEQVLFKNPQNWPSWFASFMVFPAYLLSLIDGLGSKHRLLYICKNKIKHRN